MNDEVGRAKAGREASSALRGRPAPRRRVVLKVGIASHDAVKARALAIARGELKPSSQDPKVWFPSTETLAKVLSASNRELLGQIRERQPQSVQALSDLTGRKPSNLSRTLRTMQRYGLVRLVPLGGRRLAPKVTFDRLALQMDIPDEMGTVPTPSTGEANRVRSARRPVPA